MRLWSGCCFHSSLASGGNTLTAARSMSDWLKADVQYPDWQTFSWKHAGCFFALQLFLSGNVRSPPPGLMWTRCQKERMAPRPLRVESRLSCTASHDNSRPRSASLPTHVPLCVQAWDRIRRLPGRSSWPWGRRHDSFPQSEWNCFTCTFPNEAEEAAAFSKWFLLGELQNKCTVQS